ncbi:MAG: cytochrome C [Candidatus Dadabacteria bacterium]|nr:MAG: cytochrome C [Candidatus Dadabacteria bacterium]
MTADQPASSDATTASRTARIWVALLSLFVLMQLVPYGRNHSNPDVRDEPQWDSPRTRTLFMRTCGDCHSHETKWPWYSWIAPASWLVYHDVAEGREHFNVSNWSGQEQHGDEAVEEYREGDMPPWFYLPLHPEARLGDADRQALLTGLEATFGTDEGEGGTHDHDHDD